jgi:hypothetical protein
VILFTALGRATVDSEVCERLEESPGRPFLALEGDRALPSFQGWQSFNSRLIQGASPAPVDQVRLANLAIFRQALSRGPTGTSLAAAIGTKDPLLATSHRSTGTSAGGALVAKLRTVIGRCYPVFPQAPVNKGHDYTVTFSPRCATRGGRVMASTATVARPTGVRRPFVFSSSLQPASSYALRASSARRG